MLSPQQLLERCNQFRRAGGAEELDKLRAGKVRSPINCLIARNLNFECIIGYSAFNIKPHAVILSQDQRLVTVAEALGLTAVDRSRWPIEHKEQYHDYHAFELPEDLGDSARRFDLHLYPPELYE